MATGIPVTVEITPKPLGRDAGGVWGAVRVWHLIRGLHQPQSKANKCFPPPGGVWAYEKGVLGATFQRPTSPQGLKWQAEGPSPLPPFSAAQSGAHMLPAQGP